MINPNLGGIGHEVGALWKKRSKGKEKNVLLF